MSGRSPLHNKGQINIMSLISLQNIKLAFGGPEIFSGVSFQINRGERVCLIGRNGEGKSTLLKVINNEIAADSGEVISRQNIRITSLSQEVPQDIEGTVFEFVLGGMGSIVSLLSQYNELSNRLSEDQSSDIMTKFEKVQHEIESVDGWQIQQQVDTILSRLGLDPDAKASDLSGGYKRKVLLAKALVKKPDLLLLDEPTNHLDIDTICWLEEFLKEFSGSILFITHDRKFLQSLATRIVELDRGRITDWPGDYQAFLRNREALLNDEAKQNALFDKKLAQEEKWIRQGIKARRTRNEGRVRALKKLREERGARREQTGSATMSMNMGGRSGKRVIEAENLQHKYNDRPLINDFSTTILRGDKIGIIGPNGSGKTTLLRILLGSLKPDSGMVKIGANLEVAYFDQHRMQLDDNRSVMDNVADGNSHVTVNGNSRHLISYLSDFLFPPERSRSAVSVLSGGERNRLLLAKLFTKPSNMLIMDEPTNDLDADTLELLEELLIEYKGTLLVVSHDREFLNNIVTSTIVFEGDGRVNEYVGGYDDWLRQRTVSEPSNKAKDTKTKKKQPKQTQSRKLSFKENQELETLPGLIDSLESERESLFKIMADPDFYKEDGDRVSKSKTRIEDIEKEMANAYTRWELLEAIRKETEET